MLIYALISYLHVCSLWHNQLPTNSFTKLKRLKVSRCNKLLNVFPLYVAKALVQLKDLYIESCGVLGEVVGNENEDETTFLFLFPKPTSLRWCELPQLKRFCSRRFTSRWGLLKTLEVSCCDKVEMLSQEIGLEDEPDTEVRQPFFLVENVHVFFKNLKNILHLL